MSKKLNNLTVTQEVAVLHHNARIEEIDSCKFDLCLTVHHQCR